MWKPILRHRDQNGRFGQELAFARLLELKDEIFRTPPRGGQERGPVEIELDHAAQAAGQLGGVVADFSEATPGCLLCGDD